MKQLIYGQWGPNYREKLLDTCAHYLQNGEFSSFFYIVPTAALAADIRERLLKRVPGWLGKPVLTFDDLIDTIIQNSSVRTQRIDSVMQERIMHHLMLQSEEHWSGKPMREWAHYPGIVSTLLQSIAELRRAGATVQMLSAQTDENTKALVALWSQYETWLRNTDYRTLDVEEGFILAHEILASHTVDQLFPYLKCVIFDHFLDFTPLQKRILQHVQVVRDVEIYIPFLQQNRNSFPELASTMDNLQTVLGRDFNITALNQFGDSIDIGTHQSEQQESIHAIDLPLVSVPLQNIEIYPLQSNEKQWLWIAKHIKRLLHNGVQVNQIALLVPDLKSNIPAIDRLFRMEGIPHRAAVTQTLTTIPIIQDIVSLLRIVAFDWERQDVQAVAARWNLIDNSVPVLLLERLVRRLGIQRGQQTWFQRIQEHLQNLTDDAYKMSESKLLVDWLERLKQITDAFPRRATMIEYVEAVKTLLHTLRIKERLVQAGTSVVETYGQASSATYTLETARSIHELRRDMRAVERVEEWLKYVQQIEQKVGNEKDRYTIEEFLDLVTSDWETCDVSVQDPQEYGVWVLEPSSARGLTFAHVFFANLNEGTFPKTESVQWLLADEERRELHKKGIPVAIKQLQMELQKAFFSMALTLATDSLYLLYTEETGSLRSRFLDALLRDYPALADWNAAASSRDPYLQGSSLLPADPAQISNQKELDLWNAWQLAEKRIRNGEAIQDDEINQYGGASVWSKQLQDLRTVSNWRYVAEAIQMENQRLQSTFGSYEGVLSDPFIQQQLQTQFNYDRTYSASFFNQYGECAFKFFLARVLRVELPEDEGDQLNPIDRGNLYHAVLFRLYAEWQEKQDKNLDIAHIAQWLEDLQRIFEEEVERFEQRTFVHTKATWPIEKQHIWNNLQEWLNYDLTHMTEMEANMKPHRLEWSFGMPLQQDVPSDPHSIEAPVKVAGLPFQGRIDRIDYSEAENLYTIYDYKTTGSSLKGMKDVLEGIDFQLPIYLQVVSQLKTSINMSHEASSAGALYYGIEKVNRAKGLLHESYREQIGLKRQSHVKADEWDELLQQAESRLAHYHNAIRQGQFPLQPRKCSDSCPFKTVCRYDDILALNKQTVLDSEGVLNHE